MTHKELGDAYFYLTCYTEVLRDALLVIGRMPDEANEWDGVDRFRECRKLAQEVLKTRVGRWPDVPA